MLYLLLQFYCFTNFLITHPFQNISVAIVGKDQPFKILNDEENLFYLNMAKNRGAAPVPSHPGDNDNTPGNDGDDGEGGDGDDRPSPNDPLVLVATMEH